MLLRNCNYPNSSFPPLKITSAETPDSVSISSNVSLVMEDQLLQLHCDITNVAPARSLAVWWYQRNDTFEQRISGGYMSLHMLCLGCDALMFQF